MSVPLHGRTVKGWVLGPPAEDPRRRLRAVRRVRSAVRFFDSSMLQLLRWVSERYVVPLATVIERSHPPRVASEEVWTSAPPHRSSCDQRVGESARLALGPSPSRDGGDNPLLRRYQGADPLEPGATTWLRPSPQEEVDVCLESVTRCVGRGRQALVLVPEAQPVPATGRAVLERFGDRAAAFLGGDGRGRYRTWLEILRHRYDVVVGTRPAVFAPLSSLGLVWISREVHRGHREDRSPYYHVREVAIARARLHRASCVLSSLSPSVETAVSASRGEVRTLRLSRPAERRAAPLVETTAPRGEDRSPRLARLLRSARSGAIIVSRRGYGVARVCRSCGEPAACRRCLGPIVVSGSRPRCSVCSVESDCPRCGGRAFGVERGGTESIAAWATRAGPAVVELDDGEGAPAVPAPGRLVVGTAASVKDIGPQRLDVVGIVDADRALARAGLRSREGALATWMEAAAWAGGRGAGGRVLVQTRRPSDPAIQALVRWEPLGFLLGEAARRESAGFPPSHPVFRVRGLPGLERELAREGFTPLLTSAGEGETISLFVVLPAAIPRFRQLVLGLAQSGMPLRVEAEPQL